MAKSKKTVCKRQSVALDDYAKFVTELKKKIRSAQFKAALAVNRELIRLYWDIGKEIVERKEKDGWGSGVIDRIARDIQNEFPGIEGFSRTNMGRMRAFYLAYSICPQAVGKLEELPIFNIPWGHNIAIFEGVKSLEERLWYANMVIQEGWSRNALIDSIKIKTYQRHGKAITNFHHLNLRCFVVIELKAVDFKPEFAGKMNFYLSAVDDLMRKPGDNPTIGILICKRKDNFIAEYALRDIHKPMGVAEYETKIVSSLPKKLKGQLPTIDEIEAELSALPTQKIKSVKRKKES